MSVAAKDPPTVIMIAGNHDSAERLGFGAALMEQCRCFIRGPLAADIGPIELADSEGPVRIYPIPYAEPALVRERLETDTAHCHDSAMAAITARLRPRLNARVADRAGDNLFANSVLALDAATGEQVWRFRTEFLVDSSPLFNGGNNGGKVIIH